LRRDRPSRADRQQRPDRSDRPGRPASWELDAFGPDADAELPPWAGPPVYAARPGGTQLRPPPPVADTDSDEEAASDPPAAPGRARRRSGRRAAAARLRKSRRRVLRWSAVAIVACVIAAVVTAVVTHHTAKPLPYVTALQKGEFKSVPDACTAVSPAVLSQYLPGASRTTVASVATATDSGCSFTVDSKPRFLVLSVTAESYQPFAAASGDGSASDNALDNFITVRATLLKPPKRSPVPPAVITPLAGLGSRAFTAVTREHAGRIMTDLVTVAVLERNVIITIGLQGQESGGGFGPVDLPALETGAQAVARDVLAKARTEPTA
jgi:hypothetical protein